MLQSAFITTTQVGLGLTDDCVWLHAGFHAFTFKGCISFFHLLLLATQFLRQNDNAFSRVWSFCLGLEAGIGENHMSPRPWQWLLEHSGLWEDTATIPGKHFVPSYARSIFPPATSPRVSLSDYYSSQFTNIDTWSSPSKSNPNLTQQYFNTIVSILKGSEKAQSSSGSQTNCQQCISTFQTLHKAAHKISPSDITTLLSQLCVVGFQLFRTEHCNGPESLYGGSAIEGPYMSKFFFLLDESTQDLSALCSFKHDVDCPALPVVKIKESDWFTSVKSFAKGSNPKSGLLQ